MQIEGSADEAMIARIEDVIKEQYDETLATLIAINVVNVLDEKVYIVQTVSAWEGDDEYTIHTETIRVDDNLTFTLLSEHDLDLRDELS